MIITQFNRFCEKHGKLAFLVIALVIVIPFVFMYGPVGSGGGGSQTREIGRMYGKRINPDRFMEAMTATEITFLLRSGQLLSRESRMFSFWVDQTLRRIRGLKEARRQKLDKVDDQEVMKVISGLWIFQDDGKFSADAYKGFAENFLKSRRMNGQQFDQIIRENIALERLESKASAGVAVSEEEIRDEFERQEEKLNLKHASFNYYDYLKAAKVVPTDEQIQAYFQEHKGELLTAEKRRIRVATFAAKEYLEKAVVAPAAVQADFEKNQAAYKGRSFEQVKDTIAARLQQEAAEKLAATSARAFQAGLKTQQAKQPDVPAAELFTTAAKAAGATVADSGPFSGDAPAIPNIGKRPNLQRRAYALNQNALFTSPVRDGSDYAVACFLETLPGQAPEALDDDIRKQITALLETQMARDFYTRHVESYRDDLALAGTPAKLKVMQAAGPDAQLIQSKIDQYLMPYFVPEQKKALVAQFKTDDFKASVSITDDDIKAYYDDNQETYQREEVQASHILLLSKSGDSDEARAKVRAKLEGIRKQIAEGQDFAKLARQHSEDPGSKTKGGDLGYFPRGMMVKPFEEAAFALKKGEVSELVETSYGYHLIKLDNRRDGRTLAEVSAEIRQNLLDEKAEALAEAAAAAFADTAFKAVEAKGERSAADAFREAAADQKVTVTETQWFKDSGAIQPLGYERELLAAAYKLNAQEPLADVVKGRSAFFVSCWLDTKAAYLPAFDEEPGLSNRVSFQMNRERATEMARQKAAEAVEALRVGLEADKAFAELAKAYAFQAVEDLNRSRPPRTLPEAEKVLEAVSEAKANTVIDPIQTDSGALVVYLESRTLPDAAEFEKQREAIAKRLENQKKSEAVGALYERLELESETVLNERWRR